MAKERLQELEELLIAPSNYLEDEEFEELQQEAIKLREMLRMLE
ncbi:hypothetical protein [Dyadobacter sp. CY323]|nr:hypothetical protein [Dyadobacter sp. CY323]